MVMAVRPFDSRGHIHGDRTGESAFPPSSVRYWTQLMKTLHCRMNIWKYHGCDTRRQMAVEWAEKASSSLDRLHEQQVMHRPDPFLWKFPPSRCQPGSLQSKITVL